MYKRLFIKVSSVFIVFTIVIISLLSFRYSYERSEYLKKITTQNYLNYQSIYNKYKDISSIIFNTQINNQEILSIFKEAQTTDIEKQNLMRKKLFKLFIDKYKKLKLFNLKQLHFHLPNSISFLRMHRPNVFGDDLTGIRETLSYVNITKQAIDGFEEGRIYNGFRFVYPLFDENKTFLGSVEVSFDVLALIQEIFNTYYLNANFLIRKDIVNKKVFKEEKKNYIDSPYKEFYYEKNVFEKFLPNDDFEIANLLQNLENDNAFSIYNEERNIIKTFISLKNPITKELIGTLYISEKDKYITNFRNSSFKISLLLIFTLFLILYIFYKQKISNIELRAKNNELDRKFRRELEKNQIKNLQIIKQSKMITIANVLNSIAHQWRQPLSVIATSISGMKLQKEIGTLDDKNFEMFANSIEENSAYLSETIENFRAYIQEDKTKKTFSIQERVKKTISILESALNYHDIIVEKDIQKEALFTNGVIGDLSQVLLNILNNSKDVLIEKNDTKNKWVKIKVIEKDPYTGLITIEDNGGGIKFDIIDKIFEPYFTSKHQSMGTGMGLFMAYEIMTKNLNGKIYVENSKNGAKFYLELPLVK